MIYVARRDPSLDTLVDLHGQVLVINAAGYWVRFVVQQVPAKPQKPLGLDYSLTMHAPDGTRLVGFDNAHQVEGKRREAQDHKHRLQTVRPYAYNDAAALVTDFWSEVEAVMKEKGIWP